MIDKKAMEPDYEYRYRQAIDTMQRAEVEIVRLRALLLEEIAKTAMLTIIAEEALEALEYLSSNNQA